MLHMVFQRLYGLFLWFVYMIYCLNVKSVSSIDNFYSFVNNQESVTTTFVKKNIFCYLSFDLYYSFPCVDQVNKVHL